MRMKLIAIVIGMACLLGAPVLAAAQATPGVPTQTAPPGYGR
jgi:hypothetical protein